jgi:putative peptidoglycan lipid II flippase
MTQKSVITYAIGLQAFMLNKILSSAFYARQDIRTPVKISTLSLGANIILSVILVWPFAHAGLALATSLASWMSVLALGFILYKNNIFIVHFKDWKKFLIQLVCANGILAVFLWLTSQELITWIHWSWQQRLLHISVLVISSCVVYIFYFWITKSLPKLK